jgi:hypothetical protein
MQTFAVAEPDDAGRDIDPGLAVVGIVTLPSSFHFKIHFRPLIK